MMMGFQHKKPNLELQCLIDFGKKYQWQMDLSTIITNQYDAIVLTTYEQKIEWVSKGFFKMTGYPASFAKGKRPTFLQGKDTSATTREYIRQQLALEKPFSATVINYRKDNSKYSCIIQLYPLKDADNKITHFLALEKEIAAIAE